MHQSQPLSSMYFETATTEVAFDPAQKTKPTAHWLAKSNSARGCEGWTPIYLGSATLFSIWAIQLFSTWATWGNATIDSGHEMYIPTVLAHGKMLYRDVWFMYTPLAPYFNGYLFRVFGIHLNVLYFAGALAALGSAIFLFLAGVSLSSGIAGWAAGAVILLEAFRPSLFSFPLPYSFSPVYGCFVACLFIWLVVQASKFRSCWWMFSAGMAAAAALLLKPEYGMASYCTLALLILSRGLAQKSWTSVAADSLAVLPGALICAAVIAWMVSIAGVDFIIHENIVSWPTAYFMKAYGKLWLKSTGFDLSAAAFRAALIASIPIAAVAGAASILLRWIRRDGLAIAAKIAIIIVAIAACVFFVQQLPPSSLPHKIREAIAAIFFPPAMVLYISIAALIAWSIVGLRYFKDRRLGEPAVPLILAFSGLLAFRLLLKMAPEGYSIYYNGPVVFCFLLLACAIIPVKRYPSLFRTSGAFLICLACLSAVPSRGNHDFSRKLVPLVTERGTMRLPKNMAENYAIAVKFMRDRASRGESVIPVPEDTSLFFFSETTSPMRVFSFTPGVLAPGKMTDELISEIDRKRVRYLLWSNKRVFPEYGTPVFGVDFDKEVGDYFKSHYHPVGLLVPDDPSPSDWNPTVWERNSGE